MSEHRILFMGLRAPSSRTSALAEEHEQVDLFHLPTVELRYRSPKWRRRGEVADRIRESAVLIGGPNAAEGFARWLPRLRALDRDNLDLWTVGPLTARAIRERVGCEARVLDTADAESLAVALAAHGRPVVLAVGGDGRPDLHRALDSRGVEVVEIAVYELTLRDNRELRRRFRDDPGDWLVFSTARSVDGFLLTIRRDSLDEVASRLVSLTEEGSRAVEEAGGTLEVDGGGLAADILLRDLIQSRD